VVLKEFLHAVKSYDMVPSGFTSIREEGVLRIFIALKNPSTWPGSNTQSFGPVTSTPTITPSRREFYQTMQHNDLEDNYFHTRS
jgi:hypothetical protein